MTHTPGPWIVDAGSVRTERGVWIAKMDRNEPHTLPTERDANARLIAQAPELAKALQEIGEGISTYLDCREFWTRGDADQHLVGLQELASRAILRAVEQA